MAVPGNLRMGGQVLCPGFSFDAVGVDTGLGVFGVLDVVASGVARCGDSLRVTGGLLSVVGVEVGTVGEGIAVIVRFVS